MKAELRRRWDATTDAWRTQLWPVPAVAVTAAVGLGVWLPWMDARFDDVLPDGVLAYLFTGGPEAARTVLSVIAGSLITVTSLTFSLTVVTLQLASSQFSPRLLRTFARDRLVHLSLGLLLGTFTYTITVLRTVRASLSDQEAFVPQAAVTIGYLLALVSVMTLVVFLAHLAQQVRVEWMLREVHSDAKATIRRVLDDGSRGRPRLPALPPRRADGQEQETVRLCAAYSGFFTSINEEALLAAAVQASAVVYVDRLPGDSLIAGTPVARACSQENGSPMSDCDRDELQRAAGAAIGVGFERTAVGDIAFGLRQIVDVTVKALSPGVNDPTTAVHGLGHLSALLCEAASKDLGARLLTDQDGQVRVVLRRPDFAELLELAVAQPRRYGAGDPDVLSRIVLLLGEVAWTVTAPGQLQAIGAQLERVSTTAARQEFDDTEQQRLHGQIGDVRLLLSRHLPPIR